MKSVSEQGFTLVEASISLAIVAGVMLAATEGILWMSKNKQKLAATSSQATGNAMGSGSFATSFATATIAVQFEHVPVPNGTGAGCSWTTATPSTLAKAGPCTSQLSGGILAAAPVPGLDVSVGGASSPVGSIEFFRDDSAALNGPLASQGQPYTGDASDALITHTTPIASETINSILAGAGANTYYVSWPFVPDPSGGTSLSPLMVLQGSSASDPLSFDTSTGGTKGTKRYELMQATNFATTAAQILNTIYVIYNANDPSQYFFQYAADAQDCAVAPPSNATVGTYVNAEACVSVLTDKGLGAPGAWGGLSTSMSLIDWFENAAAVQSQASTNPYALDTNHYFAVDFEPLSDGLAVGSQTLANYYSPNANDVSPSMLWIPNPSATNNFLPVATTAFTLSDPTDTTADFQDFPVASGSGEVIHQIDHYFHANVPNPVALMASPVSMTSFALSAPVLSSCLISGSSITMPCSVWNLVSTSITKINAKPFQVNLMTKMPLVGASTDPTHTEGAVVVARPIGSESFQLFYFNPGNVTVSN